MDRNKCLLIGLVAFILAIGLAGVCSCSMMGDKPVTIYNQAGPAATMDTPPPPNTTAQAVADDPAPAFNWRRFWSITGAALAGVLVFLVATGNLHPFKPFQLPWPFKRSQGQ